MCSCSWFLIRIVWQQPIKYFDKKWGISEQWMDEIHLNSHAVSTADGNAALCLSTLFSFLHTVKSEDEETSVENKLRLQKQSSDCICGSYRLFENSSTASHQSRLYFESKRERRACRSDALIWLTGNESRWSDAATGQGCLSPLIRCQNKTTFFNLNNSSGVTE